MEKRNVYIQKFEENLNEYNEKLAEMRAKVAEAQFDMKAEYLSKIENLEKKRDHFVVEYEQLKESGGMAWDNVKAGTEKAWKELEDGIAKAITHFK